MWETAPRVLVVEDEGLIAADLATMLEEFGCECVGPVMGLSEGIRQAQTAAIDAAIINLILDGQPAYAIAEALDRRGVPFGFASGVMLSAIEPQWRERPFLRKPYLPDEVKELIKEILPDLRQ